MELKDTLTIAVAVAAAAISLVTFVVVVRSGLYDRTERSLLAIDNQFVQFPLLRPYFYGGKSIDDLASQEDKQRCIAIAELILDVFVSTIEQRRRFFLLANSKDLNHLMSALLISSPVLASHLDHGYIGSPARLAEIRRYAQKPESSTMR